MRWILLIALASFVVSCAQEKVDTKTEAGKLRQVSKDWSKVASAGDVNKTISYWADDAVMISEGMPVLRGKAAIKNMVEESFKIPGFSISWEPEDVVVSEDGDMAYIIENSQVSYPDSTGKSTTHYNKAVSIWRKQADGSWKNVVDISTPVPPPAN